MEEPHVHYRDVGAERIALLIHGLASSAGSWRRSESHLAFRGYNTLSIDLAGHGHAPRLDTYSFTNWVDQVVTVIDRYRTPDLIIAHSLGGLIAAGVATQRRPHRMLLLDPLLSVPPALITWIARRVFALQARASAAHLRSLHPSWPQPAIMEELWAIQMWDSTTMSSFDPSAGAAIADAFFADPGHPETLILKPKHSFLLPADFAGTLSGTRLTVREAAHGGHSLHMDNQRFYLDALDEVATAHAGHPLGTGQPPRAGYCD